jgi:hypothetical protein
MNTSLTKTEAAFGSVVVFNVALALAFVSGCAVNTSNEESVGQSSAALSQNSITRESFDNLGRQGNGDSTTPFISGNQQFVVFQSEGNAWAPTVDTNRTTDVYLKDRNTGAITLESALNGVVGNAGSLNPSVSDSGKVAFVSNATNLAPGATGPSAAILVNNHGAISRADVALSGAPNGPSTRPQISGDGNWVVFQSDASNLVAADTNGATDVFVRNLNTNQVVRASVTGASTEANGASFDASISYDGRFVAFTSNATNLDFRDFNGVSDVFVRDLQANITFTASFSTTGQGGAVGNGASSQAQISGDGQHVAFRSFSTNWDATDTNGLADIYVKDLLVGPANFPIRVSLANSGAQANGPSFQSAISFSGNAVAFVSTASNLIASDTNGFADVFVRERSTNQTIRADQLSGAGEPNGSALINSTLKFSGNPSNPSFSFLVFDSNASNLTFGDTNGFADVFSASLSP